MTRIEALEIILGNPNFEFDTKDGDFECNFNDICETCPVERYCSVFEDDPATDDEVKPFKEKYPEAFV